MGYGRSIGLIVCFVVLLFSVLISFELYKAYAGLNFLNTKDAISQLPWYIFALAPFMWFSLLFNGVWLVLLLAMPVCCCVCGVVFLYLAGQHTTQVVEAVNIYGRRTIVNENEARRGAEAAASDTETAGICCQMGCMCGVAVIAIGLVSIFLVDLHAMAIVFIVVAGVIASVMSAKSSIDWKKPWLLSTGGMTVVAVVALVIDLLALTSGILLFFVPYQAKSTELLLIQIAFIQPLVDIVCYALAYSCGWLFSYVFRLDYDES